MPKAGFCVVQERIPITVECRNGSSRQIRARVEVGQTIHYKASGSRTIDYDRIGNFSFQISPSSSDTKSAEFDLPTSLILDFTTEIITISHSMILRITHSMGIFGELFGTLPISVPFVIGNVPFHGTGQPPLPPSPTQLSAAAAPPSQQPGYPPPQGPGVPQPAVIPQPSVVDTPPNAELQSQAPPTYNAVISGENF